MATIDFTDNVTLVPAAWLNDVDALVYQGVTTAALVGSDGTVGAPAYSFSGDTDSGLYRIGANNLGVAVNGAKVLDIGTGGLAVVGLTDLSNAASGQIKFPATQNASADANTLDDYDEYVSASTACSGALTDSVAWRLTKIGRVVTITLPPVYNTTSNVASITYGLTIPAKYRPTSDQAASFSTIIAGAGSATPGLVAITTAGVITLYRDGTTGTGWGTGAATGMLYTTSMSWVL